MLKRFKHSWRAKQTADTNYERKEGRLNYSEQLFCSQQPEDVVHSFRLFCSYKPLHERLRTDDSWAETKLQIYWNAWKYSNVGSIQDKPKRLITRFIGLCTVLCKYSAISNELRFTGPVAIRVRLSRVHTSFFLTCLASLERENILLTEVITRLKTENLYILYTVPLDLVSLIASTWVLS